MRTRIFDIHLPRDTHRCHVAYCTFANLPFKRRILFHNFRILYLLQGRGRYWDDVHDGVELNPGAFLLRPPNHAHEIERLGEIPWLEFAIVLPAKLYRHIGDLGVVPRSPLHYWPKTTDVERRLKHLFDRVDGVTATHGGRVLHEILGILLSGTDRALGEESDEKVPQAIQEAMDILSHDLDQTLAMPMVAKQVGMGYHAFRKAFAKYVGHSPKEYRIHRVIEKAQNLLLEDPDLRLYDVAYELGYPDPHSFSKQFKRVTGQSPSVFRET